MCKQQKGYTLTKGLKFIIHEYLGAQAMFMCQNNNMISSIIKQQNAYFEAMMNKIKCIGYMI